MVKLVQNPDLMADKLLEILESHGEMNISQMEQASGQSYWQVRRNLEKLMSDDKVMHTNTIGRKYFFQSKSSTALPSYNAGKGGFQPLGEFIKLISKSKFFSNENNLFINRVLTTLYAQPIFAKARSAIDERGLQERADELDVLETRLENALSLIRDLKARGLTVKLENFQRWYDDPTYNPKLALLLYSKVFPESSGALIESASELNIYLSDDTPVEESNESNGNLYEVNESSEPNE